MNTLCRWLWSQKHLPDVHLPDDAKWQKLGSHGDSNQWEMHGRLEVSMAQEELLDYSAKQIVALGWTLRETKQGKRTFAKKDRDGQTWVTTIVSAPDAAAPSTYLETMTVRKASSPALDHAAVK